MLVARRKRGGKCKTQAPIDCETHGCDCNTQAQKHYFVYRLNMPYLFPNETIKLPAFVTPSGLIRSRMSSDTVSFCGRIELQYEYIYIQYMYAL